MFSAVVRRLSPTFLRDSLTPWTILRHSLTPWTIKRPHASPTSHRRLYNATSDKDPSWILISQFSSTGAPPEPPKQTPDERWEINSSRVLHDLAGSPPATAYQGRSVRVVDGNVAEAYRKLEIRLSRNKVRYELKLTERHEKKGVKRRRLSSERWRNRFADEVRKKVALVKAIRRRGS